MNERHDAYRQPVSGFHDDSASHFIAPLGLVGDDLGCDFLAARATLGERSRRHTAERRERAINECRRIPVAFERSALAQRVHRSVGGRIDENVPTLAAAAVFALDKCVADNNTAAHAGAEREKNETVILLGRTGPELTI